MSMILFVVMALGAPPSFDVAALGATMRPAVVMLLRANASGDVDGTGTGFLIDETGWIATNHHVIENAKSMVARFADGTEVAIEGLLAESEAHDLAIVKIAGGPWPTLELGDIAETKPGDPVAVLGHPLGLGWTLSDGIVAAVRPDGLGKSHVKGAPDGPVVQFTAAATFGSSGSPVVDRDGRVIAVVQSIVAHGGLRLAVSVDSLRPLIEEARTAEVQAFGGSVVRNLVISAGVFILAVGLWRWFDPKRRKRRARPRFKT